MPELTKTLDFGYRVAKAMIDFRSGHMLFLLHQAYPEKEDWGWSDFKRLLDEIMEEHYA